VPIADIAELFDHLISQLPEVHRNIEAKRLGGLKVDHQIVLGRCLYREIGGLLALEDAVDIAGRAAIHVDLIRPIGDQAAGGDVEAFEVEPRAACGGPPARRSDRDEALRPGSPSRSARRSERARRPRRARSISPASCTLTGFRLHPKRWRHGLDGGELAWAGSCGGIPQDRHAGHAWRDLFEQFQPFAAQAVLVVHEAGGIAARPRQAVDEAGPDRIDDGGNTIGTVRVACSNAPRWWRHGPG